jgi:uncharacterized iron-regulated membrane protein
VRRISVLLHRWLGLFTALFLAVAGLTGALIAWDHELDAWLNPQLFAAASGQSQRMLSGLELADRLEAREPRLTVRFMSLEPTPGKTLLLNVAPRLDPATGKPFALDYTQVFVDPATSEIQGRRMWGAFSLARENVLPFLYRLHYTLHLPNAAGLELGVLWMGIVALVWALDGLIALYISFPSVRTWRRSFSFRFRAGGAKLLFDLHRSSGVWVWVLLLVLAVSGVSMNLRDELVRPLVALFSPLTPSPFAGADPPADNYVEPRLDRLQAIKVASDEARRRGIAAPAGGMFYAADRGVYGVGFYERGDDHGDGTLGNPWVYLDALRGSVIAVEQPGEGSAGDLFMQAQFPLHSGRVFGLAGRVVVSLLGLVVAMLSITGVIIWARKRRARAARRTELTSAHAPRLATREEAQEVLR